MSTTTTTTISDSGLAVMAKQGRYFAALDREIAEAIRCYDGTFEPDANAHTRGGQLWELYRCEQELVEHVWRVCQLRYEWWSWSPGECMSRDDLMRFTERLVNGHVEELGNRSRLYRDVPLGGYWKAICDRAGRDLDGSSAGVPSSVAFERDDRLSSLSNEHVGQTGRPLGTLYDLWYDLPEDMKVRYLCEALPIR